MFSGKENLQKRLKVGNDADVIKTSQQYALRLEEQIGRYFYASNTPFSHASHQEFKSMINLLRPGFEPPSPYLLGNRILDEVHNKTLEDCKKELASQTVSMSMDGWSNIHNESIICFAIMTQTGKSILVETIDTSGYSHNANYLVELAVKCIQSCEEKFNIKVRSFVTDNASNVTKMRENLSKIEDIDLVHYGCSAHLLNLLAKDLEMDEVNESVIKVIKYFRNKHLPAAWFKAGKGKKLILPQQVRWNTVFDSIKSYLDNRGILVQICQDHKDDINDEICSLVNSGRLTKKCQNYNAVLGPIAIALDRMQSDMCTISIAVEIWYKLQIDLQSQSEDVNAQFNNRRDMALTSEHYLANLCDHRFRGEHLSEAQKQLAYELLSSVNPDFVPIAMAFVTRSSPFLEYLFGKQFRNCLPLVWWKSVNFLEYEPLKQEWLKLCEKLFTAVATSANLERIFSTFGLVHSKLRNRLGVEKASKLTFLFKYFNQEDRKKIKLDWCWPEPEPEGGEEIRIIVESNSDSD